MGREWQQTLLREYLLPDTVYYQSIWAVRDLNRMEARLEQLQQEEVQPCGSSIVRDSTDGPAGRYSADARMAEMAVLNMRISAIRSALSAVPEEYRSFILSNLILRTSGRAYPNKLWKYWKQRFLYTVAKNLKMI